MAAGLHIPRGRILIAWKHKSWDIHPNVLHAQFIHCKGHGKINNRDFDITFVYGFNRNNERVELWDNLKTISQQVRGAWYIYGDCNSILSKDDRENGTQVHFCAIICEAATLPPTISSTRAD